MLPKLNRLRREQDFAKLARRGQAQANGPLSIKCLPNESAVTRCGIVVGKTVHKRAVKRNLLRRRLREAIRPLLPQLAPGYDFMVLTRTAALPLKPKELQALLVPMLIRAGLLPRLDRVNVKHET